MARVIAQLIACRDCLSLTKTLFLHRSLTFKINKLEFSDSDLIFDIKCLAFYPDSEVTSCTISQVVGSDNVAAWDLVPLSISEVAAATKTCKIFGKLYRAVKIGQLDLKDKDISKFNGVFDSLYIQNDVIHFGSRICIPPVYHDRLLSELHSTHIGSCLLYTSPSPRDRTRSRMPSSA